MKTFYEIEFTDGSHFPRRPKTLTAAKAYVSYVLRYEGWKHEDIARINFVRGRKCNENNVKTI